MLQNTEGAIQVGEALQADVVQLRGGAGSEAGRQDQGVPAVLGRQGELKRIISWLFFSPIK